MAANTPSVWVYKCNRREQEFARAYGDWADVFRRRNAIRWGGSWSTKNPVSTRILNELIREEDLVLAYQTDDRSIAGICRVSKVSGDRGERSLWLMPLHRFDPPIPIHELKGAIPALRKVSAFNGTFPQMLYAVSPSERRALERACGVKLALAQDEPLLLPRQSRGAGFGDPETNRLVERNAIAEVTKWYRSQRWKVQSVEADKCGYDLLCRRDSRTEYVEVKGVAGDMPNFVITAGELAQAKSNPAFVICVVVRAISRNAKVHRLTGAAFRERYELRPLQFKAVAR